MACGGSSRIAAAWGAGDAACTQRRRRDHTLHVAIMAGSSTQANTHTATTRPVPLSQLQIGRHSGTLSPQIRDADSTLKDTSSTLRDAESTNRGVPHTHTHTPTRAHAHTHTHTRTRAHTQTRTHTHTFFHHITCQRPCQLTHLRQQIAPKEGRLHEADSRAVPPKLLAHRKDRDRHVDAVHVAQHEREEAEANDGPAAAPTA
eukprot:364517-Chlamydomonas_euryale.AAC.6